MSRIVDWFTESFWRMCIPLTGIIVLLAVLAYKDNTHWEIYSKTHHCVVTGHIAAQVMTTITNGSVGTTVVPERVIYTCDNNEQVIR